jgi:hypothetical protein
MYLVLSNTAFFLLGLTYVRIWYRKLFHRTLPGYRTKVVVYPESTWELSRAHGVFNRHPISLITPQPRVLLSFFKRADFVLCS